METSVYVFKTDIHTPREAGLICSRMTELEGIRRCTVDLDDCDRVLRVEVQGVKPDSIERPLRDLGYFIMELPD